ncbi:uncharacterized protein LOC108201113 [Daucus carota subsp. sativus]|uniref:uncharacterized protein LOC108201113 n=1 Tax=Daucus carota subsp. sativus TaxID=79200 RepID=UPI0007EFAE6E|nr:PREDICTED: uncharacterized protein LOC108201113 [Daucus carota subsp. sativus]
MYSAVGTCVRTPVGDTQYFPVEVGLHQGLVLSPLLFIMVLDVITHDIQALVPWCMLFADDIVLIAESRNESNSDISADVTHRILTGWLCWRAATGVLCDKSVPLKFKGKSYRVAIRPSLLYGSEYWPLRKA